MNKRLAVAFTGPSNSGKTTLIIKVAKALIESGKKVIVGVNKFESEEAPPDKLLEVNPQVQAEQIESLAKVRAERDGPAVESSLAKLKEAAAGDSNLMEPIIECVEGYATIGEICATLMTHFGRYSERTTIR